VHNQSQHITRAITDEKGIADVFDISVSFVRKDRSGKRILPFFRIGDLIRYDVERCREALLANEEGGPQKATRKRHQSADASTGSTKPRPAPTTAPPALVEQPTALKPRRKRTASASESATA
jgi:hypothetical protein